MSIVGFDDMEFASLLMPPITTLRQSARELGRAGVAILLAMLGRRRRRSRRAFARRHARQTGAPSAGAA